ncbi:UDP-N-acetylmuramate dehydrogenase [Convivina praedatoris]|uniref:UDP-N-acetylenolpyruvoylglucosamine reductase n=1 Tax=Convivina praedatoris TaxID=2880963 RepID=A0ABN8H6X3_9LACO|nr:UDP-N-acetylmuramate dehydrogenase [Convivina sp. LMG 32447]CAH1850284.1 UDP-N-acetylenolpyruvoylglucosamine reductase [Convivina sp. LMG 32447]CAH1850293.1 UDP-N-acetylenolpyruvoylglucosamine reductase [Convivina sp. LMG 32447]CAH1850919.1 UDP-N-acetylenolpyruvoylglucosamine reductase [Convivina sp. LMG 32447]
MYLGKMEILENEPLAPYAYTQAGGPADFLAQPETIEELRSLLNWAQERELPIFAFGRLSNIVVRNGGLKGLVILLSNLKTIEQIDANTIRAQAGCDLIWAANQALAWRLSGLEWGAGIPGSVGGAVFMNAGAYGGQADMVVQQVTALMPDGQLVTFTKDQLAFGYRQSVFQANGGVIVSADFALKPADPALILAQMDENNYRRASKQPLSYPSNGSVFKRPVGHFAGKLIMDAGLQGSRRGGVEVSKKHAGFMVNVDRGNGNDYEDLIHYVQATIKDQDGLDLETEVRIMGER